MLLDYQEQQARTLSTKMHAVNPSTGELIQTYDTHSLEQCFDKLECAYHAWDSWKRHTFSQRAEYVRALVTLLENDKERLAALITREMGKTLRQARAELEKCVLLCNYYMEHGEAILAEEHVTVPGLGFEKTYAAFEPLGVILAVMPWNFPFWQVFRFVAPALLAGNACVLKHASNVPGCALAIEQLFIRAGFPEHIFCTLLAPSNYVEELIAHDAIKGVTLTGSGRAGSQVAEAAGRYLKKSVMELGGSDPFIVLEDADLEHSIATACTSRMQVTGQVCLAAKRMIVVESLAEQFISGLTARVSGLRVGDPTHETTDMGPLAREDLLLALHEQVTKSIALGAKLETGGTRAYVENNPGWFYAPTVLSNVRKGMPAYDEETFGPVASVIVVKDEAEALRVANDTEFGLGASIWTKDTARGERLAREIESGIVVVNSITKSHPMLPFGGVKKSGYGREMSHYGLREFMNVKSVFVS